MCDNKAFIMMLDPLVHKDIKMMALERNVSMKQYILQAVLRELVKDLELQQGKKSE
jgi:predicted HicB family RNase H-like nuclease